MLQQATLALLTLALISTVVDIGIVTMADEPRKYRK